MKIWFLKEASKKAFYLRAFALIYGFAQVVILMYLLIDRAVDHQNIWSKHFRFWTYQSNYFAAGYLLAFGIIGTKMRWFRQLTVFFTTYITITMGIYWGTLYPHNKVHVATVTNIVLHTLTPITMIGMFVSIFLIKEIKVPNISWKYMLAGYIFPVVYLLIAIIDYEAGKDAVYFFIDYHDHASKGHDAGLFIKWLTIIVAGVTILLSGLWALLNLKNKRA